MWKQHCICMEMEQALFRLIVAAAWGTLGSYWFTTALLISPQWHFSCPLLSRIKSRAEFAEIFFDRLFWEWKAPRQKSQGSHVQGISKIWDAQLLHLYHAQAIVYGPSNSMRKSFYPVLLIICGALFLGYV